MNTPELVIIKQSLQDEYVDERLRIRELSRYSIVYDEPEKEFDQIANLILQIIDVPISGISIVDSEHVWLKARIGVDATCLDRAGAFCAYAVDSNEDFFEVPNALEDLRFCTNALVKDMGIRYYSAAVLKHNGYSIGTLWIMDREGRKLDEKNKLILQGLAMQVMYLLNLRYRTPVSNLPNLLSFSNNLQCALNQRYSSSACHVANCNRLDKQQGCMSNNVTEKCVVGFIKLLNVHRMNQIFGDKLINELVKKMSVMLQEWLGKRNLLGQISFNKFVFAYFYNDNEIIEQKFTELQTLFSRPIDISNTSINTLVKMGGSIFPDHGRNVQSLVDQAARAALNPPEKSSDGIVHLYKKTLDEDIFFIAELHRDLNKQLEDSNIMPFYQPQVDFLNGELIGFEALARWIHPTLGFVSPGRFLPLAEQAGLTFRFDMLIFDHVCRDLYRWQESGLKTVQISVNLSRTSLLHPDLVAQLNSTLNRHAISRGMIEIEITESGFVFDYDLALNQINALRDLGLRIAIDDFGTGLSNLETLRKISFDRLKIDRQFVHGLTHNPNIAGIFDMICNISELFKVELICEGLENMEDILYLKERNIGCVQGWFFSEAIPAFYVPTVLQQFSADSITKQGLANNPLKIKDLFSRSLKDVGL